MPQVEPKVKRPSLPSLSDPAKSHARHPLKLLAGGVAAAVPLLLAACGDGAPVDPPPPAPTWIALVPDSLRFTYLGERVRAQVRVQHAPELLGGGEVEWSSTDTAVFTVDAEGEVTARANGEAALVAGLMGLRDTARVRVRQEASLIEVLGGGGQRGAAGLELLDPLHLRLTDAGGTLMAVHAFVDFDASAHGGRMSFVGQKPHQVLARWVLGPAPGPQSLLVTVLHGTATAEIGAVALHPDSVAAVVVVNAGEDQGAPAGEALEDPVVVAVLDTLGRRLRGASVRFEPAAGHGSADPAETVSDSLGLAATVWTLGEDPGVKTLVASAGAGARVEVRAVAQSDEGVCARTPVVADEIVRLAGVAGCADVTEAHLAQNWIMRLSNRGIRRLRTGDFAGMRLDLLDLSRNELTELPPGLFEGLASLRALNLGNNRLTALPPGVFGELAGIRTLYLYKNRLDELPPGVFDGLADLTDLLLHDNRLAELPEGVFGDLAGIRILWLRGNRLAELPPGVFEGLVNLTDLHLASNQLSRLPPDVFADLASLEVLHLNHNGLQSLPPGVFDGLDRLEELNVGFQAGRRVYQLPPGIFDDLERLKSLNLWYVGLIELRPGVFDGLQNVESLNLGFNYLAELPPGVFGGLGKLRSLNLQDNELTELPPGIFAGLRSLEGVRAAYNPGSPFAVRAEFTRLDAGPLAPGPAQLAMRVPGGAPEALRMPVSVQRGTGSAAWLEVAAGDTLSAPMLVERPSGSTEAVHLSFGQPAPLSSRRYFGLELVAGEQLALFAESDNRTPEVAGPVPAYWVPAGSGAVPLELAPHFRDPDGDSLVYGVETSDEEVAGGSVAGGVLWMEARSEGEAVLEVTASDADGLAASQRVALEVGPAPDPDRFNIELVFGPGFSERHREVARQAADRWEEIVVGDLSDVPLEGYLPPCGTNEGPGIAGVIDDLVILMNRHDLYLSLASGCGVRAETGLEFWSSTTYATHYFEPEFDRWHSFYRVVLHEIGHALGIGFNKWLAMLGEHPDTEPPDRYFPGPLAIQAFNAAGGLRYDGRKVPVENVNRIGRSVHWRYSVFDRELMSTHGGSPLISAITVQALADLGHVVDVTRADPYTLPGTGGAAPDGAAADGAGGSAERGSELVDVIIRGPVTVVDSTGKVVRVIHN